MTVQSGNKTFFRQSSWMVFATVVGGLALYGVHPFARKIPESEYGVLGLLLAVLNCMSIPALGLQMVFAQQAAAAITDQEQRQLARTARGVLLGGLVIWLAAALLVFFLREALLAQWKISNPVGLWLTLLVGLAAIWSPVFGGILLGQQNFLWVGWAAMLNGIGRVATVAVIVLVFQGYAAGMAGGILAGALASLFIFAWFTRQTWLGPGAPASWKAWLGRVIPLTFGYGAYQFMFSADPLFVQAWFDKEQTGFYMAAGTLGRALVAFTGPVVQVMFPKVVRSEALSEHSGVRGLALVVTGGMAALGALALALLSPVVLAIIYGKDSYQAAVPLVRWFALVMVPLALANVLLNDLMARRVFKVVPWLVLVVAGYVAALFFNHGSFVAVIQTLGVFNLLFLGLCAWCARRNRPSALSAT